MTGPANTLEFPNVFSDVIDAATAEMVMAAVCEVQSFDVSTQTAEVFPVVRRNGERLPAVGTVPVLFPVAYQDIEAGTYGILICTRENWRRWWRTGELSDPEDDARHHMTNGLFLPSLTTQGAPRQLDADTAVLLRPGIKGVAEVRLGIYNATKAVVHEDIKSPLDTFLTALDAWGKTAHANWAAASAAFGASVTPTITALKAATYTSPSVFVED